MVLECATVTRAVRGAFLACSRAPKLLFAGMMLQVCGLRLAAHSPTAAAELLLAAERMVTVRTLAVDDELVHASALSALSPDRSLPGRTRLP